MTAEITLQSALTSGGITLILAGLILAILSYIYTRKRIVIDRKNDVLKTTEKSSQNKPYRGMILPLQYPTTKIEIEFKEKNGLPVEVNILDFITPHGTGHKIFNYCNTVGESGKLATTLTKGVYDIHFRSTDNKLREIIFNTRGYEFTKPYEKYAPVGLTLLTIGFFLLIEGLSR